MAYHNPALSVHRGADARGCQRRARADHAGALPCHLAFRSRVYPSCMLQLHGHSLPPLARVSSCTIAALTPCVFLSIGIQAILGLGGSIEVMSAVAGTVTLKYEVRNPLGCRTCSSPGLTLNICKRCPSLLYLRLTAPPASAPSRAQRRLSLASSSRCATTRSSRTSSLSE